MRKVIGLFICCALMGLIGCEKQEEKIVARPVKAMEIQKRSLSADRVFPGKVEAATEVNLAFRVAGQLHEFPVNVGQFVKEGQLVARLDTTDYRTAVRGLDAQLKGAKASLNEARLQYQRYEKLLAERTASQSAYDQAKAKFETARSKVESLAEQLYKARSDLKYASLVAPFSGYVAVKQVDNFETVNAGQGIVQLQDIASLDVTVGLPDDLVARRSHIVDVKVAFDAFPGKSIPAKIKEIATDASRETRTYAATVTFERPEEFDVLPGMAADVTLTFNGGSLDAGIILPETAVFVNSEGKSSVWVYDATDSKVHSREVVVGQMTSHGITVAEGVVAGDTVVVAGVHFLHDGQQVRLLKGQEL